MMYLIEAGLTQVLRNLASFLKTLQVHFFSVETIRREFFLPPLLKNGTADFAHSTKTLFIPVSKGPAINVLKGCPNASPPVPEQCFLAFSASSQYSHRFNSESSAILMCNTLK